MAVLNVHERLLPAGPAAVGALLDSLATDADRLWPGADWPPMRLSDGLTPGSHGGHGPVRYTVCAYVPGQWVRFTFSGPRGFHGFHEYTVHPVDTEHTLLRHTLAMRARGPARLTWPLLYRHLHDAVLEDSLDHAEHAITGQVARPARWSRYVRLLRQLARGSRTSQQESPHAGPQGAASIATSSAAGRIPR
ncbi:SRPBCC family protein [Streptomyces sp. CA-288835]|uniref:SRPBCC family protein n=1 Tax=Streptomyces sp. CA-288835 TaxID=3240069 RepID=UPI003D92FBB5